MVWGVLGFFCLIRKIEICMWFIDNGLFYGKDWKKDGFWFFIYRVIILVCFLLELGFLISVFLFFYIFCRVFLYCKCLVNVC